MASIEPISSIVPIELVHVLQNRQPEKPEADVEKLTVDINITASRKSHDNYKTCLMKSKWLCDNDTLTHMSHSRRCLLSVIK